MGETSPTDSMANDFVGYEVLIDFLDQRQLHKLNGDLVEIGAFMGGGTVKLAKYAQEHGKKVYVIDVFDPKYDDSQDTTGTRMCDIYEAFLHGRSQAELYQQATQPFDNIVTIEKDSKEVRFPQEQRLIFGFIDGNHHPEYVRNDFHIIWCNLVPGGIVGFHDYNFDLPEITQAIDKLIDEHKEEIEDTHEFKDKYILLITKKTLSL